MSWNPKYTISNKLLLTIREYGSISERSLASRKLDFDKLIRLSLIEAQGVGPWGLLPACFPAITPIIDAVGPHFTNQT